MTWMNENMHPTPFFLHWHPVFQFQTKCAEVQYENMSVSVIDWIYEKGTREEMKVQNL